jgi:hypothetical protein
MFKILAVDELSKKKSLINQLLQFIDTAKGIIEVATSLDVDLSTELKLKNIGEFEVKPITLSEIIWIRKGDPEEVLVEKDKPSVHYFYWKWVLYKPEDYEPIMLLSSSDQEIIVSRYHWIFTMVWNNVVKIKDKAVADFIAGVPRR